MTLFDENGRLIPVANERVYSKIDRRYFRLAQPKLDTEALINNYIKFLDFPQLLASSKHFITKKLSEIKVELLADDKTANIFKGVHVPFVVVKNEKYSNFTEEFSESLLRKVQNSFQDKFLKYEFKDFNLIPLNNNWNIVEGSRWEKIANSKPEEIVVGWYFPTSLAGFAIPDQRTLIARLPKSMILSGPTEVAHAFIGTPEILMKTDDNYPNLLALSSVISPDKDLKHFFWYFEAYGWNLNFNSRSMIGAVSEYYSGGISVIS
jgi:hypothetical protein